jgi:uncharacterized repeat protein (TIGR02543 family)
VPVNSTQAIADLTQTGDNNFTRPDYDFAGWTTVKNDPATITDKIDIHMASIAVYALWNGSPAMQSN